MAASKYDEDLTNNSFFLALKSDFPEIVQEAIAEGWLICVPKAPSLPPHQKNAAAGKGGTGSSGMQFDQHFMMRHILVPQPIPDEGEEMQQQTHFRALDDREVKIVDRIVTVAGDVTSTTRVLFAETCYDDDLKKFKLLCLDKPIEDKKYDADLLETSSSSATGSEASGPTAAAAAAVPPDSSQQRHRETTQPPPPQPPPVSILPKTVKESSEFIGKSVYGKQYLKWMHTKATNFIKNVIKDEERKSRKAAKVTKATLQRDLRALFTECLDKAASWNPQVRAKLANYAKSNGNGFVHRLSFCIEHCLMHTLYGHLAGHLANMSEAKDAALNGQIRANSQHAKLPASAAASSFSMMSVASAASSSSRYDPHAARVKGAVAKSQSELMRLAGVKFPSGKIQALFNGFRLLSEEGGCGGSSDDLLPTVVFVVAKTGLAINNWYVQLECMRSFRLAFDGLKAKFGAAFVNSAVASNQQEIEFQLATLEAALEHVRSGGLPDHDLEEEANRLESHSKVAVFRCVRSGQVDQLRKVLLGEGDDDLGQGHWKGVRDEFQRSALHLAAIKGDIFVLEVLLSTLEPCQQSAVIVNHPDVHGRTALHQAAFKGHQNAVLLLLHANANLNLADVEGNTALHLATASGREACVKALIYYAEHLPFHIKLSSRNFSAGDTALHLASKWGHGAIAQLLLNYGANREKRNAQNLTPLEVAYSPNIAALIQSFQPLQQQQQPLKVSEYSHRRPSKTKDGGAAASNGSGSNTTSSSDLSSSSSGGGSSGINSEVETKLKVSSLFRAINVGDLTSVSDYIGIRVVDGIAVNKESSAQTPSHSSMSNYSGSQATDRSKSRCQDSFTGNGSKQQLPTATTTTPSHSSLSNYSSSRREITEPRSDKDLLVSGSKLSSTAAETTAGTAAGTQSHSSLSHHSFSGKGESQQQSAAGTSAGSPSHSSLSNHSFCGSKTVGDNAVPAHVPAGGAEAESTENLTEDAWMLRSIHESVDSYGPEGLTPLQAASKTGNADAVRMLLEMGASAGAKTMTARNETALHIACRQGHLEVVQSLTSSKNDDVIGVLDGQGNTALHLCAVKGHHEIAKHLLDRCRASAEGRNLAGKTPQELARDYDQTSMVQLFMETKHSVITWGTFNDDDDQDDAVK